MRIAVLGAVVVGGVGGGLAAWSSSPGSGAQSTAAPAIAQPALPKPAPAAPSIVPPTSPAQPTPPAPAAPDPHVVIATQMRIVLARFAEWSRHHAGAPCPDGAALGAVTLDPWDHPIELTCTDQPADQRAGAISGGVDGVVGNEDDVTSWTLGREVTDLVRGPRWSSTRAATTSPATAPAASARPAKPSTMPSDAGADDIPARR
jgi:hypothetical protein